MGAVAAAFGITAFAAAPAQASCNNLYHQDVAGVAYIEVRDNGDVWIYHETNGQPGLQRGGQGGYTTLSAADCNESSNPDTIVY